MKAFKTTRGAIRHHLRRADTLAVREVEKLVRQALRNDENLLAFYMGNGVAFFDTKAGGHVNAFAVERGPLRRLSDFLNEWDDTLHLSGCPITINQKQK